MRKFLLLAIILSIGACSTSSSISGNQKGGMQYSLSSRWFHPRGNEDIQSTLDVIKKLRPKRIDWTYTQENKILDIYTNLHIPYSLTINPQVPDSLGYTTKKYRIIDYKGKSYTAPWMKNWGQKNPYWGCVNNPLFYDLFLKQGEKLASLGAYAIMVDDALFNARLKSEQKVGCFCEHCELKFKIYNVNINQSLNEVKELKSGLLKEAISNQQKKTAELYIKFQEESVIEFLKKWKNDLRKSYPNLLFLTNNFNGSWNAIYQVFDGGIAELRPNYVNDKDLDSLYFLANSLNKSQLFTIATEDERIQFAFMEYNAKNHRETLLPWDINIVDKNRRYYMPIEKIQKKIKELNNKYK